MGSDVFYDRDDAVGRVCQMISRSEEIPTELRTELVRSVDAFLREGSLDEAEPSPPPLAAGYLKAWEPSALTGGRRRYWVIRNEHLKLFASLSSSGQAIVGYTTAATPNPVTLAVALVLNVVALGIALRRKGIELEEDDFRMLMALKQHGPQSVDGLALILNGIRLDGPHAVDASALVARLEALRAVQLRHNAFETLVVRLPDGRWAQNGL